MGLEGWFPLLGTYTLKENVGVGLVCVTLRLSLIKGGVCWTSTMGKNEEIPNYMGQYICIWSVGNGGQYFCKGRLKFHGDCVSYSGSVV